jgi:hypothetical protein
MNEIPRIREARDHPDRGAIPFAGASHAGTALAASQRATFHRWYDRFLTGGVEALQVRSPRPRRVWNRIPEDVWDRIVELALDRPELSPRVSRDPHRRPRRTEPSSDPGQDRTLAPDVKEPNPARKLLPARRSRSPDRRLRLALKPSPLSREPTTSPPPTSPSDAATPSCCKEIGSSERQSNSDACSITKPPPKMPTQMSKSLH